MSSGDKKRPKAPPTTDPVGTGPYGSPTAEHKDRISLTLRIADSVRLMSLLYAPSAVALGAIIGGCEIAMGRGIVTAEDQDLEQKIQELADLCISKRDPLRESATTIGKQPKGIM